MDPNLLVKNFKTLIYTVRLRFSPWSGHFFICMLNHYLRIKRLENDFRLKAIPNGLIQKLPKTGNYDVNNVIIVSQKFLDAAGINTTFVKIFQKRKLKRIAFVLGLQDVDEKVGYVSDNLLFNLKDPTDVQLRKACASLAPDVELSLINPSVEIKHEIVNVLLKNYFEVPKLVKEGDILSIGLRDYHPEFFYTACSRFSRLNTLHFKCRQVLTNGDKICKGTVLCVYGETILKLSSNDQSYVEPLLYTARELSNFGGKFENCLLELCPHGLEAHADLLRKSITPFLNKNLLRLNPCFLLQGKKGSGKYEIVSSLASKLGLHLYKVSSGDIAASTYALSEVKLVNTFSKAKACAPCILVIDSFENFGKNNEGQHDDRIINFFKLQLKVLFADNKYPVILLCLSNSKDIPASMSRTFLEIFEMDVPDNGERVRMLEWILKRQELSYEVDLDDIANKSRGFLFEDLKALVYHAKEKSGLEKLTEAHFTWALDLMQSKYSQSLGAPKIPKVQWSDVGGLTDVKQEITKTVDLHMKHPEFFVTSGLKCSGVLLYGPPGTGKTLLAKAVATECNLCFLSVKGPELLNMYIGQSEKNIREVFDKAREASPCIIFFDELDSLAPNRGASGDSGGVMDRVVSQLLAEMDGLNQQSSIFIIGATNRPDLIDQALLRPGRFDKLLYVGPCIDNESKFGVLKALTRKFNMASEVDLWKVIELCPTNITGADFYGLAYNAWMSAVRKVIGRLQSREGVTSKDVVVTLDDFRESLKDLKPSITAQDLKYFAKLQAQFGVEAQR